MMPTASATPTSCSTAVAATDRELKLGLAYLQPPSRQPAPQPPQPSRWERYTQALLATNEFLFID